MCACRCILGVTKLVPSHSSTPLQNASKYWSINLISSFEIDREHKSLLARTKNRQWCNSLSGICPFNAYTENKLVQCIHCSAVNPPKEEILRGIFPNDAGVSMVSTLF